jgi:hypothetical protein
MASPQSHRPNNIIDKLVNISGIGETPAFALRDVDSLTHATCGRKIMLHQKNSIISAPDFNKQQQLKKISHQLIIFSIWSSILTLLIVLIRTITYCAVRFRPPTNKAVI